MIARRNPELTRERLLEAAFQEVHRRGFRAASLEDILETAGVTKGALYHHFSSKLELGYAIVDEVIHGWMREKWLEPLEGTDDPVGALREAVLSMGRDCDVDDCTRGCPLNNLTQEMSAEDEGFRRRLRAVTADLQSGIAAALRRGQEAGTVRPEVEPERTASFLFAAFEGISGMAKNAQDPQVMRNNLEALADYIEGLRAARPAA